MADTLTKRLGLYAPNWRPKAGDQLIGRVRSFGEIETDFGPCPTVVIVDPTGKAWTVWLYATVLKAEWERHDPQPGDCVGIAYNGMHDRPLPGRGRS